MVQTFWKQFEKVIIKEIDKISNFVTVIEY